MSDGHEEKHEAHGNDKHASQPDYSKALGIYENLKKKGLAGKADEVLAGLNAKYHNNVPPKEMEHGLKSILTQNSHGKDNVSNSHIPYNKKYTGLAGIVGIAAFGLGIVASAPAL